MGGGDWENLCLLLKDTNVASTLPPSHPCLEWRCEAWVCRTTSKNEKRSWVWTGWSDAVGNGKASGSLWHLKLLDQPWGCSRLPVSCHLKLKTFLINRSSKVWARGRSTRTWATPRAEPPWRGPAGPLLHPCVWQETGEHPCPDSSLSGHGWLRHHTRAGGTPAPRPSERLHSHGEDVAVRPPPGVTALPQDFRW